MHAQALVMLPNGWQVAACSEAEAMFIYHEIVDQQCYLQEGIQINNGDVVLDIGANVGQCTRHWFKAPLDKFALSCLASMPSLASKRVHWRGMCTGMG